MRDETPIKTARRLFRRAQQSRCLLCGRKDRIEKHHVAGRNHDPKLTAPLCQACHAQATERLRRADVKMQPALHAVEGILRALMASAVFREMLAEAEWHWLDSLRHRTEKCDRLTLDVPKKAQGLAPKSREEDKMSLKTLLDNRRTGQAGTLLHGSDVPEGTKSFTIEVAGVREAPEGFGALVILDLKKPVYGKTAWAVNMTNLEVIRKLFGDDEEELVGQKIKLDVKLVRNPKSGEMVRSLAVSPKQ